MSACPLASLPGPCRHVGGLHCAVAMAEARTRRALGVCRKGATTGLTVTCTSACPTGSRLAARLVFVHVARRARIQLSLSATRPLEPTLCAAGTERFWPCVPQGYNGFGLTCRKANTDQGLSALRPKRNRSWVPQAVPRAALVGRLGRSCGGTQRLPRCRGAGVVAVVGGGRRRGRSQRVAAATGGAGGRGGASGYVTCWMVLVWGPAMFEAARTTASPAAIWTIVVVAVVVLAFWLTAVMLADRYQVRTSGRWRTTREAELASGEVEPASGGGWAGGSLPGADAPEIPGEAVHEPISAGSRHARDGSVPEGDIPTRVDLPAQSRGPDRMPAESDRAQPTRRPTMPAQRSGDADRAKRSYAGSPPDEDESDQSGRRP